jgi:membrane protease YdiL (CAAX protease family)
MQSNDSQISPPMPEKSDYSGFWERQGFSPVSVNFIALAILFFLYQIVGGVLSFAITGGNISEDNIFLFRLLQSLFQFLFLAVPTFFLVGLHTNQLSLAGKENQAFLALNYKPSIKAMSLGALGAVALNPLLSYVGDMQIILLSDGFGLKNEVALLKKQFEELIEKLAKSSSAGEFIWVAFVMALTPAICEELVFRGLIQKNFARMLSPSRAVVFTGTLFGLYHLNPIQTLPLIGVGIYISYLRQSSGSIWTSMAAHFAFNFFSVCGIFILDNHKWFGLSEEMSMRFKDSDPDLLSPTAVVSAVGSLLIFLAILNLYRKETSPTNLLKPINSAE